MLIQHYADTIIIMQKSILLLFLGLSMTFVTSAQSKKEQKQAKAAKEFEKMKALIKSKEFDFQADWATTAEGRRISLTTNANFLKFNKDTVNIYLPYFGVVTSGALAMTDDGGIIYHGPVEQYKMSVNEKKKKIIIDFVARGKNDTYEINLSIFKGGNTLINLISNFRSSIKYDGIITTPRADKK